MAWDGIVSMNVSYGVKRSAIPQVHGHSFQRRKHDETTSEKRRTSQNELHLI
jgi:hypothetical protein